MEDEQRKKTFLKRNGLLLKAAATALITLVIKWAMHRQGWELIAVNPLFAGIVAADVFLMSFLLSGVWSDYKESEKLPGELASTFEAMADEAVNVYRHKDRTKGSALLSALSKLDQTLLKWFKESKRDTKHLMTMLEDVNDLFVTFDRVIDPPFIARMKQELATLRRLITRVRTIRATEFVSGGYLIARVTTVLVVIGLVLAKIEPFYEAVFFVGVITLLLTFMILLIKDLDNPFGYYEKGSTQDVSLYPVEEVSDRLRRLCADTSSGKSD